MDRFMTRLWFYQRNCLIGHSTMGILFSGRLLMGDQGAWIMVSCRMLFKVNFGCRISRQRYSRLSYAIHMIVYP